MLRPLALTLPFSVALVPEIPVAALVVKMGKGSEAGS